MRTLGPLRLVIKSEVLRDTIKNLLASVTNLVNAGLLLFLLIYVFGAILAPNKVEGLKRLADAAEEVAQCLRDPGTPRQARLRQPEAASTT